MTPSTDVPTPAVDPAAFRRALGSFASGVTVVTALRDAEVAGITVSAFSSVSLDPPLVLVCVGNRANFHGVLRTTSRFAVSLLGGDQERASNYYAGRREEGWAPPLEQPEGGVPVLGGALATLQCDVHDAVEMGDHTVFFGRVTSISVRDGGEPLAYWRGRYRRLADAG